MIVHPGDGTHGGAYYKFDMIDGTEIKVIDPLQYVSGTINKNTIFYNQSGQRIIKVNGYWVEK